MKRIALISEHASPLAVLGGTDSGGQNIYVGQVAKHLALLGYKVDVFTRKDSESLPETVPYEDGVRVINITAGPAAYIRKEDMLPYMYEFADHVAEFIRFHGTYDIIHANFWMSGLVAVLIKRQFNIPFVITFHALGRVRRFYQKEADEFPDIRLDIEDLIISHADRIIAECVQDKDDLCTHYNTPEGKIAIIPCGYDPQELWPIKKAAARAVLGFAGEQKIVLQLGRMVPRKGIDTAVRGFSRFLQRHEGDVTLVIVGGASEIPDPVLTPEIGRLQNIAREEGITEHVVFRGRAGRSDLKYYYSAADVFVTTPWYEPFGITPLEAMACGAPVIGSRVGGIKSSVVDGETGYLIPPRNPVHLADRLRYLYAHPDVLQTMSCRSVKRVRENFTWEIVTKAVAALYRDVIAVHLNSQTAVISSIASNSIVSQANDK